MKVISRYITICFIIIFTPLLQAQDNESGLRDLIRNTGRATNKGTVTSEALSDSSLYSTVVNIAKPVAPFVYGQYLMFIYYNKEPSDRAFIAFAHEHYSTQHVMKALANNPSVKVYALPRTHEVQTIQYRLIINNIWTRDTSNPNYFYDNYGIPISSVTIPQANPLFLPSIVKINDSTIRFYLYLDGGMIPIKDTRFNLIDFFKVEFNSVFLVGSFTSWDPYLIAMMPANKAETLFYADVPVTAGTYYYYYQIGGTNILDPKNSSLNKRKSSGEYVNSFQITASAKETTGARTFVLSTN